MKNKRIVWADIAKGILIILVVLGHSTDKNDVLYKQVIYWFHMPAFFIISGYLFKPYKSDFLSFVKKKAEKFFVPYAIYCLIIIILLYHTNITMILKSILLFAYSGRTVPWVFWFIPCLFLTEVIFGLLNNKLKKKTIIITLIIMYVIAHLEAIFYIPQNTEYLSWSYIYKIPWNADVVLMTIPYFGIGFYFKETINSVLNIIKIYIFIILSLVCVTLIGLNYYNLFNYNLDMKLSHYTNFVLDILIPILFVLCIFMFSKLIEKIKLSKGLIYIGKYTLPIMYFHLPFNAILQSHFNYAPLLFVIIGVFLPLCLVFLFSRNEKLKYCFGI